MKVTKKKVLKNIWEKKFVDKGILRPVNTPQVIAKFVKVVYIGLLIPVNIPQLIMDFVVVGQVFPATFNIVITEDIFIEVDIGHKRPATITLAIR